MKALISTLILTFAVFMASCSSCNKNNAPVEVTPEPVEVVDNEKECTCEECECEDKENCTCEKGEKAENEAVEVVETVQE